MKTKKLIVLAGPTGIGKTNLSLELAQEFNSEIISCDGRQFYQELNIGVAKPTQQQLNSVKHHFISHISIKKQYTVGDYEKEGLKKLNSLFKKNDTLFLVGGSGLYIDAICEGLHKFPIINNTIRKDLELELKNKGIEYLNKQLLKIDPETYSIIDKKNPRRIIRALEVFKTSKKPYSYYKKKKKQIRNFNTLFVALNQNRENLYKKIDQRTETMIHNGLIDEVKNLYKYKDLKALQTIGYNEVFKYIEKKYSLEDTINEIKKNTRRYAKRQITWFKNKKYIHFNISEKKEILNLIKNYDS